MLNFAIVELGKTLYTLWETLYIPNSIWGFWSIQQMLHMDIFPYFGWKNRWGEIPSQVVSGDACYLQVSAHRPRGVHLWRAQTDTRWVVNTRLEFPLWPLNTHPITPSVMPGVVTAFQPGVKWLLSQHNKSDQLDENVIVNTVWETLGILIYLDRPTVRSSDVCQCKMIRHALIIAI